MRILVLSNEVWNDDLNGNNVISNWFEDMPATFANIYCSSGAPFNKCCFYYFQVTDSMMFNSLFSKKAGRIVKNIEANLNTLPHKKAISFLLFLKKAFGNFLRFGRDLLWLCGRYNKREMKCFVNNFNPDIIFSERMATCKMLRLERIVRKFTSAPFFAFTGDDEYSLKQFSFSPFFWINRFMIRGMLRKNVKFYSIYYSLSLEQINYYRKIFGCKCKLLQKCGTFNNEISVSEHLNNPIKVIYAGKLYCNRWKSLAQIVKCMKEINKKEIKIILNIFTKDKLTKRQQYLLNDGINSFVYKGITQEDLKRKYAESDIAVHVESLDFKNRLSTRFSFSTKIVDCLFSGCAILAYCWKNHSGLTFLQREDSAFCVTNYTDLNRTMNDFCNQPKLIIEYKKKAMDCAVRNNLKQNVQKSLLDDFILYSSNHENITN